MLYVVVWGFDFFIFEVLMLSVLRRNSLFKG